MVQPLQFSQQQFPARAAPFYTLSPDETDLESKMRAIWDTPKGYQSNPEKWVTVLGEIGKLPLMNETIQRKLQEGKLAEVELLIVGNNIFQNIWENPVAQRQLISQDRHAAILAFRIGSAEDTWIGYTNNLERQNKLTESAIIKELLPAFLKKTGTLTTLFLKNEKLTGLNLLEFHINSACKEYEEGLRITSERYAEIDKKNAHFIRRDFISGKMRMHTACPAIELIREKQRRIAKITSLGTSIPDYLLGVFDQGKQTLPEEQISIKYFDQCLERDSRTKEKKAVPQTLDPEIAELIAQQEKLERRRALKKTQKQEKETSKQKLEAKESTRQTETPVAEQQNARVEQKITMRILPSHEVPFQVVRSPQKQVTPKKNFYLDQILNGSSLSVEVHERVIRWDNPILNDIRKFPDTTLRGKLRYPDMDDLQIKETRARHCFRGLDRLLQSIEFRSKYLYPTTRGGLLKTSLKTPFFEEKETLTSLGISSLGVIFHAYMHHPEELFPTEGCLIDHLYHHHSAEISNTASARRTKELLSTAVTIEEVAFKTLPIIRLSFAIGDENQEVSIYPL